MAGKSSPSKSSEEVYVATVEDKAVDYVRLGSIDSLNKLIEESEDERFLSRIDKRFGMNTIMMACEQGRIGILSELLLQKVKLNIRSRDGNTVLIYATRNNELEMIKMLSSNLDLDVNIAGERGNTALMVACKKGYMKIVELLIAMKASVEIRNDAGETALTISLKFDQLQIAKYLLVCSADINSLGENGNNSFMRAAFDGRLQAATFILDQGIDINQRNIAGETAFLIACKYRRLNIASLIIKRGSAEGVNVRDNSNRNILMYGCMSCRQDIFDFAIENHCNVDDVDIFGSTALMMLSVKKKKDEESFGCMCVSRLISKGVNVNAQDKNFNTALILACMNGCLKVAVLLVENGADSSMSNQDGRNALDYMQEGEEQTQAQAQAQGTLAHAIAVSRPVHRSEQQVKPVWLDKVLSHPNYVPHPLKISLDNDAV